MRNATIGGDQSQMERSVLVKPKSQPNAIASTNTNFKEFAMTDLDPEIWNNETLGEAAQNGFLDERTAQDAEDRAARIEGREPMVVRRLHQYPGSEKAVSIANSYDDGLRRFDASTGEMGVGEYGQVSPDGEPENPGYEKDETNGEADEFSGTETESGGSDGAESGPVDTNSGGAADGSTDDGYQA